MTTPHAHGPKGSKLATPGQFTGEQLLPGTPGYEAARLPSIPRFRDTQPALILRCRTPAEVAEALRLAHRTKSPAVVRSGGHDFAGRSSTTGVLIDLSPMNTVRVTEGRVAVGPGVRLGELYQALHEHGLTIPGGSGPTVGIGGLTLGGGFGLLGRLHGLTCDSLLSAQLVLADGRILRCDTQQHPTCSG